MKKRLVIAKTRKFTRHFLFPLYQKLHHPFKSSLNLALLFCLLLTFAYMDKSSPPQLIIPGNLVIAKRPPPQINARHVFVFDRDSKEVLFERSSDTPSYPASTTKMVTALVAIDTYPLDQKITVTKSYPEGQDIGLEPGETLTTEQLLYALLVHSANDAAEVLAENYPHGGRIGFIQAMNQKAFELKLHHTHFINPSGLDEEGQYSSAADLVRIADELLKNPYLARIVNTETALISSPDQSPHVLSNVNQLLGKIPGVMGVKTGFTDLAGQSLVTFVQRENTSILISVLGSTDRFADTKTIIDWVFQSQP